MSFFYEIKCNGTTSFMEFIYSSNYGYLRDGESNFWQQGMCFSAADDAVNMVTENGTQLLRSFLAAVRVLRGGETSKICL